MDGIIDTGSSWSMIDITFCIFLKLPIHSFHMYHVFSAGAEGDHMACATLPVKGWVEVELNIPELTTIPVKFWLVDIMTPAATTVVIGCHLLKEIYANADQSRVEEWPTPWKELFEWSSMGYWYDGPRPPHHFVDSEDDTESSCTTEIRYQWLQELPRVCSTPSFNSYDSWESLV